MTDSKFVHANEKIAEGVVGGYKKIEEGVVDGFEKMTDKFVDAFLTHDGETTVEAKARLASEQEAREQAAKEKADARAAAHQAITSSHGSDIARASVEASLQRAKEASDMSQKTRE